MKVVILGAGKGFDLVSAGKTLPKVLTPVGNSRVVLDYLVDQFEHTSWSDIIFVGGDGIKEVIQKFPMISYRYNPKSSYGNIQSVLLGLNLIKDDVLVMYADVLYSDNFLEIVRGLKKTTIFYDSAWKKRYAGRDKVSLLQAEKVYVADRKLFISKENRECDILGEFAGAVFLPKERLKAFLNLGESLFCKSINYNMVDLVSAFSETEPYDLYDLYGQWSELDNRQDYNSFEFGTKAETLAKLKKQLEKSKVLSSFFFTVGEWRKNRTVLVDEILKKYTKATRLIVRSSAVNEDTVSSSMAGNYESVLDVECSRPDLERAVEKVVESFSIKGSLDQKDQVLIQEFITNVENSGVVFTRDIETKAPYYVINYDDSTGLTDSVTSGNGLSTNVLIVNKFLDKKKLSSWQRKLIDSVDEICAKTNSDFIDIEYAISGEDVFIFQVRPIAAHKDEYFIDDYDFSASLESSKEYIRYLNRESLNVVGNRVALGVMPDWNPAEIIGINPKRMALSIYKELITDNIWPKSRIFLGYRDIGRSYGMLVLSGKPYVDVRASFNTLTPATIDDALAEKLMNYYLRKLELNPWLHDKVEFAVVFSSYYIGIEKDLTLLKQSGFSDEEVSSLITSYKDFTNNILSNFKDNFKELSININKLESLTTQYKEGELSIDKAFDLIHECKSLGTFSFSVVARYSFIASRLLKSFVDQDIISKTRHDQFFKSIKTVSKQLIEDLSLLDYKQVLIKYGHLRPGTYNIESLNYSDSGCLKNSLQREYERSNENETSFIWTQKERARIQEEIELGGIDIPFEDLIQMIKTSIEGREYFKFIFTKALNEFLIFCEKFLLDLGFEKKEIAHLSVNDILSLKGVSLTAEVKQRLKSLVRYNRLAHQVTMALKYPSLIFDEKDLDIFTVEKNYPNFVTQKLVSGEVLFLSGDVSQDLEGKIVLIENADPGFDWIFTKRILGLVTKYGGVASHMAIRAAELGLPAIIGCGDLIYSDFKKMKSVEIDCGQETIIRLF